MPPRLRLLQVPSTLSPRRTFPLVIRAQQPTQIRNASILGSLADVPSSYNKRIRRGRGPSSGKGKTSGRGHKGQKQHGKVPAGFNGGQTPLEVVHGKRGFENQFSIDMSKVNLDRIQSWIDQGRLDPSMPITVKDLVETRCMHGVKDGVKLLAKNKNELRSPIHIVVSRASAAAIEAVEAAGGSVTTRYYTHDSIRRILKGQTHPVLSLLSPQLAATKASLSSSTSQAADSSTAPSTVSTATSNTGDLLLHAFPPPTEFAFRLPDPASRKDIEYYRDPAHRGYLSYQVGEGQGPSLFFKTPLEIAGAAATVKIGKGGKVGAASKGENRMW